MDTKFILKKVQRLTQRVAEFDSGHNRNNARKKYLNTLAFLVRKLQGLVVTIESQISIIDEFKYQENSRQQKAASRIDKLEERIVQLEKIIATNNGLNQADQGPVKNVVPTENSNSFQHIDIKMEPLDTYETESSVLNETSKDSDLQSRLMNDKETNWQCEPLRQDIKREADLPAFETSNQTAHFEVPQSILSSQIKNDRIVGEIDPIKEVHRSPAERDSTIDDGRVKEHDPLEMYEKSNFENFDDWDEVKDDQLNLDSATPSALNSVKHNLMDVIKSMRQKIAGDFILCAYENCGLKFDSMPMLKKHEKERHLGFIHNCTYCDNVYRRRHSLSRHMNNVHQGKPAIPAIPRHKPATKVKRNNRHENLKCNAAGCEKTFTRKASIIRHYKTGHPNICYNCGGEFSSQKEAMLHRNSCNLGKNYKCMVEWCPKTFATYSHAFRHFEFIHSSSHRFKCKHCIYYYESKQECSVHMTKCKKNKSVLKANKSSEKPKATKPAVKPTRSPNAKQHQSIKESVLSASSSVKPTQTSVAPVQRALKSARLIARAMKSVLKPVENQTSLNCDNTNRDHTKPDLRHTKKPDNTNCNRTTRSHTNRDQIDRKNTNRDQINCKNTKSDQNDRKNSKREENNSDHTGQDHTNQDHTNQDHTNQDHTTRDGTNRDRSDSDHIKLTLTSVISLDHSYCKEYKET